MEAKRAEGAHWDPAAPKSSSALPVTAADLDAFGRYSSRPPDASQEDVVSEDVWATMAEFAGGQDGYGRQLREFGLSDSVRAELRLNYRIDRYVAMERAENANGWQVTEVGVGTP